MFFFSSRRRHTSCALGTGVQTLCSSDLALRRQIVDRVVEIVLHPEAEPIIPTLLDPVAAVTARTAVIGLHHHITELGDSLMPGERAKAFFVARSRSEERSVGTECGRTCKSRGSALN